MVSRYNNRQPIRPLNESSLQELALHYVGKYATTRAKLVAYLKRKVRERGWEGEPPELERLGERMAELGYVDDAAFALNKSRSLSLRGYGKRRLQEQLRVAGVGEADSVAARSHANGEAVDAALRFARRRRIGPFASGPTDPRQSEKWVAAMVRAGHAFALARAISVLQPGAEVDTEELRERAGVADL